MLWGGYDERVLQPDGRLCLVRRRPGSFAWRSAATFHRIDAVHGRCVTLFFTWKCPGAGQNWSLQRHPEVEAPPGYREAPDGLYRMPAPTLGWRRRSQGQWYALRDTPFEARHCDRLSIHQNLSTDGAMFILNRHSPGPAKCVKIETLKPLVFQN